MRSRIVARIAAAAVLAGTLTAASAPASATAPSYSKKGERYLRIVCRTEDEWDDLYRTLDANGVPARVPIGTPIPDPVSRAFGRVAYAYRVQARSFSDSYWSWPQRIQPQIDYLIRANRKWAKVYERLSSYRTYGPGFDSAADVSPYGSAAIRRRTSQIRNVLGLPGPGKGC